MDDMIPESLAPESTEDSGCGPLHVLPGPGSTTLRQSVFECVRSAGRLPRVEVARQLDISPASVTQISAELIARGLLEEVEDATRPGHRGRPPVALRVRRSAGYVAGLKLSDEAHTGVIVDFAGNPVADVHVSREPGRVSPETLVDETKALLDALLTRAGMGAGELSALGLGLAGVVDHASGSVTWSPLLQEVDVELGAMLSDRLGLQVEIDNDANMVTLAELWFGAGRSRSNFVVVTIEQGVGMGLVLDGRLYRGVRSAGLELGHIKVQLDGALCRCGQRGCLEAYLSDYALVREASVALDMNRMRAEPTQVLMQSLYDQAKAGNEAARTIFRRAGRFLSVALSNLINLLDPGLIILSGARMKYDYLYADTVMAEMRNMTLTAGENMPDVEINAWGDLVWARGAAALALDRVTAERTAAA